jgi:hypothetical protein
MTYIPSNGGRINAGITGNTTGISSAGAVSTGTVMFAGGNNVTLSQSVGASGATISFNAAGGGVQSLTMYAVSNTTISGNSTLDARSVSLGGRGAMSVGFSGGSVLLSAPPVSTLSGAGAVTISAAGSNITIGAPAFSAGMSNIGNTSGTTGLVTNQVVFAGGNNITLSQSTGVGGNTISVAGPPLYSAGINTLGNTAGATGFATNQLLLVGGSNITLSQSTGAGGNTVSIIGAAGGTGGGGGGATGIALYDGANSISSGTASIQAVGPLTASINNQTLSLAVPALTTLTGAGGIVISSNGSTITISGQQGATISRWEDPTVQFASMATIPQGSLSIKHAFVPFYVSGTAAKIGGSLGLATSSAAQVGSISMSLWMGIYTMNGETLSLATSGSANNSFTFQGASSASTAYGTITGMRELTVPMNINMTPGEYWVGAALSTSTSGGLNGTYTLWGNTQMITASTPLLAPIGATSLSAYGFLPGQGMYKTTVANMPGSIPLSSINNTAGSNVMRANFYHAFYNTSFS